MKPKSKSTARDGQVTKPWNFEKQWICQFTFLERYNALNVAINILHLLINFYYIFILKWFNKILIINQIKKFNIKMHSFILIPYLLNK